MDLTKKHCVPCEGRTPPIPKDEAGRYGKETPEWEVVEYKKIAKEFRFENFPEAMNFVNKVVQIAEKEEHRPDIYIFYNRAKLELWTHAVKGLSENDFILAAKINP